MDLGKVRLARRNLRLLRLHEHEFQDAYNIIQKKTAWFEMFQIFPSAAFHKLVIRPGVCQSLSAHKGPCRALLNFTGLVPKHALHQLSMAWVHALYRLGGWRENLKSFG